MLENMNGLSLDLIIHTGETIKEVLEDRNMTQEELAIRTGFSAKHVSEVISGKKNISSKFANRLEYALSIPTSFWINLQGIYDSQILELEKQNNIESKEFEILSELKEIMKYCEDNNIIAKYKDKAKQVLNMRKFLNVNDLTVIPSLPYQQTAFRGSSKLKINIYVLYAWQKICQEFTSSKSLDTNFDKKKLSSKFDEIKQTMFLEPNAMVIRLKEIFKECGIIFEVVKHFKGAPVYGFIQKKDSKVILCMTIRQSFSDIFWFTLFHEIGHLINDDICDNLIDYSFTESDAEIKADEFASNILISNEEYDKFKFMGKYDKTSVLNFAKQQNVKPGILIGRIQRDIEDYSFLTHLKERYVWK